MSEWSGGPRWNREGDEEVHYHLDHAEGDGGVASKEPTLSELFMTYLVTRSNRIEEDLIDQLFNPSEKRLAAFCFCWPISEKTKSQHPLMLQSAKQPLRR